MFDPPTAQAKFGYAVILKTKRVPRDLLSKMAYTSAPEEIGGGTLWQIYKDEASARRFMEVEFSDFEYEIVGVTISLADGITYMDTDSPMPEKFDTN